MGTVAASELRPLSRPNPAGRRSPPQLSLLNLNHESSLGAPWRSHQGRRCLAQRLSTRGHRSHETRCRSTSSGSSDLPIACGVQPSLHWARRVCVDRRIGGPNSNGQVARVVTRRAIWARKPAQRAAAAGRSLFVLDATMTSLAISCCTSGRVLQRSLSMWPYEICARRVRTE
jgi:hypothetical protein